MNRLTELKKQGYEECRLKINHWEKFKSDYNALKEQLNTLPDKLSYDIMVPFGPHAFMPGSLVHTNNITVLLGDNWFTEMSTKQAIEFVQRRIHQCDRMLEDLEKEKKQYLDFIQLAQDIYEEEPKEIRELWNEEDLSQWRDQHKKNVTLYKQEEAKKRAEENISSLDSESIDSKVDDYFKRLDELQLQEDEDMLNDSDSETEDDLSDETEEEEEHEVEENINEDVNSHENVVLKDDFENQNSNQQNSEKKIERTSLSETDLNHNKSDKHVRWIDLSEARSNCITFTHSKPPQVKNQHHKKGNKRRRRNSSTSDFDEEEPEDKTGVAINSPSDIYKRFSFSLLPSKPKSILKSSSTEALILNDELQDIKLNTEGSPSDQKENESEDLFQFPIKTVKKNMVFTGEVKERFGENTQENIIPSQRPKSLFQRSRQGGTKA